MDIFRDVEHNRKATDEKLLQERQRTDSLLAGVPATGADEILDHPRADADAEALSQLVDHAVRRVRVEKTQRRHQHVLVQRPDRKRRDRHEQPCGD